MEIKIVVNVMEVQTVVSQKMQRFRASVEFTCFILSSELFFFSALALPVRTQTRFLCMLFFSLAYDEVKTLGRSLGWDNYSPYASNNGNLLHPTKTFGHTGYTGTSFIVDPESKVAVILLAHRVHPDDKGSVVRLRALVANAVAGAIIK